MIELVDQDQGFSCSVPKDPSFLGFFLGFGSYEMNECVFGRSALLEGGDIRYILQQFQRKSKFPFQ